MTAGAVFRPLIAALESAGIPYMLTGSFAAAFHGSPRATQDIDLVIAPDSAQLSTLVRRLTDSGYYVDPAAAGEALELEAQFNAIDPETGWKVDFIIRKGRPFSLSEFDRRQPGRLEGMPFFVATVEDLILAKLEWARLGESDRQIEDAADLLRVRRGEVDLAYLERWVETLAVRPEWNRAVARAGTST
jgi:hypothetical protein